MSRLSSRAILMALCALVASMLLTSPAAAAPPGGSSPDSSTVGAPARSSAVDPGYGGQRREDRFKGTLFRVLHDATSWPREYKYWALTAPTDIGQERWDRLFEFARCVKNKVGQAAMIAVVGGGIGFWDALVLLGDTWRECGTVDRGDAERARIIVYVDTKL